MMAKIRPSFPRLALPPADHWLPAFAVLASLGLAGLFALSLFGAAAEPKSPPSGLVTSTAAHGFQGLKRVLEARGGQVLINRHTKTGHDVKAGLEIITLTVADLRLWGAEAIDSADPPGDDTSEASAEDASEGMAPAVGEFKKLMGDHFNPPDPQYYEHIHDRPLGRAVLIVLPKWEAHSDVVNRRPRWGTAPTLTDVQSVTSSMAVLTYAARGIVPSEEDASANDNARDDANDPGPGDGLYQKRGTITREAVLGEEIVTWDQVNYHVGRFTRPLPEAPKEGASEDPEIARLRAADQDLPVDAEVSLTPVSGGQAVSFGTIKGLQTVTAANLEPVLVTLEGRPVLSRLKPLPGRSDYAVPVYVLSDPDLLNNHILSSPARTGAALGLVEALSAPDATGQRSYVFDLTFNGLGVDRDLWRALSQPPWLGLPIALLWLGLGLMWAAFARFGPAEEEAATPPLGRGVRILADNAARLMAVSFRDIRLGPAYAALMRDQALKARAMGTKSGLSPDDLADLISRSSGTSELYSDLQRRAEHVRTVPQLIDVARRLHVWKTETQHARK